MIKTKSPFFKKGSVLKYLLSTKTINTMINTTKTCSCCKVIKSTELFSKSSSYKDGYDFYCKSCRYETNKKWFEKNKEKKEAFDKKWRENNREQINSRVKEYRNNNKEKIKEYRDNNKENYKKWVLDNKEKRKEYNRIYKTNKRKNDPLFKLISNIRIVVAYSLKSKSFKKQSKTENILGCSFEEFKQHIESQFEPWMNWDNYGLYNGELNYGWDIDHKIPLNSASNEEEIIKLNHYTNLQPLCSYYNRYIKSGKI
jgi:hypothetical protein